MANSSAEITLSVNDPLISREAAADLSQRERFKLDQIPALALTKSARHQSA